MAASCDELRLLGLRERLSKGCRDVGLEIDIGVVKLVLAYLGEAVAVLDVIVRLRGREGRLRYLGSALEHAPSHRHLGHRGLADAVALGLHDLAQPADAGDGGKLPVYFCLHVLRDDVVAGRSLHERLALLRGKLRESLAHVLEERLLALR